MKNKSGIIKLLGILAFAFAGVGLFGYKHQVDATTPIYNYKSMPGSACDWWSASYLWINNPSYLSIAAGGSTVKYAPEWTDPNQIAPWSQTTNWTLTCPLLRDNVSNVAGINGVAVDLMLNQSGDYGTEQCWLDECNNAGTCVSGPITNYQMQNVGHINTLVVFPASNKPSMAAGTATVVCKLSIYANLWAVRYNEIGGNNFDY